VRLASPAMLVWLLLVIVTVAWGRRRRRGTPAIRFPSLAVLRAASPGDAARRRLVLQGLRLGALALLALALARPQLGSVETRVHREGVDIVLAVDVSGSMLAEDFTLEGRRANRLDAVKAVVRDFVRGRPDDRIGLVLFAARPYTQAPLTLDHGWLLQHLERARVGMIEDGTAVGSALATATNRLRASTAPSRFVVLLTDGVSNAGTITPQTAAEAAAALGIKVYTVGAGSEGMAPYPVKDFFGNTVYRPVPVEIDEKTLRAVAERTGGRYFRATDTTALRAIYAEIDRAEKAPVETPQLEEWREAYPWLVWPALLLLLSEVVLARTALRVLP